MGQHKTQCLKAIESDYRDLVGIMLLDVWNRTCFVLKCMELIASLGQGPLGIKEIQSQENQLCR